MIYLAIILVWLGVFIVGPLLITLIFRDSLESILFGYIFVIAWTCFCIGAIAMRVTS